MSSLVWLFHYFTARQSSTTREKMTIFHLFCLFDCCSCSQHEARRRSRGEWKWKRKTNRRCRRQAQADEIRRPSRGSWARLFSFTLNTVFYLFFYSLSSTGKSWISIYLQATYSLTLSISFAVGAATRRINMREVFRVERGQRSWSQPWIDS